MADKSVDLKVSMWVEKLDLLMELMLVGLMVYLKVGRKAAWMGNYLAVTKAIQMEMSLVGLLAALTAERME
jgi:hypothetical protein